VCVANWNWFQIAAPAIQESIPFVQNCSFSFRCSPAES
jgi:hypothetical protein